jgi:hypothetical protein
MIFVGCVSRRFHHEATKDTKGTKPVVTDKQQHHTNNKPTTNNNNSRAMGVRLGKVFVSFVSFVASW